MTVYGALTTPDPLTLHRTLQDLASAGVTHLAMEASSHGLDQKRLDGVRLEAGAFTNLSRDHMDYHPTVEAYLGAKLRLFRDLLPEGAPAVVDADSEVAPRVVEAARERGLAVFSVGAKGEAIRLAAVARDGLASTLDVEFGGRNRRVRLPLPGDFQVSNALVAAGLCIATGGEADAVFRALQGLEGAPGRLERIGTIRGAAVFVDYAHKPDALEKALGALRPYVRGRLIVAFGCGGDRDAGKRPIMGEIATRAADVVIVTDDNPRSENPASIRAQILAAAPGALEIGDRAEAIRAGVAMLRDGDALHDRRQGPRDRADRRRHRAALQRRGRSAQGAGGGGMSALWTEDGTDRRRCGVPPERAAPARPSRACRSTPGRFAPAISSSRSRARPTTATISSRAPSRPARRPPWSSRDGGAAELSRPGPRAFPVDDTLKAMERLGVAARERTRARIVAVTGSVGKTSAKEMLRAMLRRCGATHASAASYNNHWGVPLTLSAHARGGRASACSRSA